MMYTRINDTPTVVRETLQYNPEYPRGWFIVVPQSVQYDLASNDTPNATFAFESHAEKYAKTWMPSVSIFKNGEKEQ